MDRKDLVHGSYLFHDRIMQTRNQTYGWIFQWISEWDSTYHYSTRLFVVYFHPSVGDNEPQNEGTSLIESNGAAVPARRPV